MAKRIVTDDFRAWLATRHRRTPNRTDEAWKARGRALVLISRGLDVASNAERGGVMDALEPGRDVYETARRNSMAARRRRGRPHALAHAVKLLLNRLPARTLEHLLAVFREDANSYLPDKPDGVMADLYEAAVKEKRINIRIQEVDKPRQIVKYRVRGGEEMAVSFKRLKNLLAALAKH